MKKITLLTTMVVISQFMAFGTTYTSQVNDDWDKASTWVNGVPSGASTDVIIVKHTVELVANVSIIGTITVEVTGSLFGDYELKIGDGATSLGTLHNYGTITVKKLKVKDNDAAGSTYLVGMPIAYNYSGATLTSTGGMQLGGNIGRGALVNYTGGIVHVTGELHIDNYLSNRGVIEIDGSLKSHGGEIGGCGTITVPTLIFLINGSRPSALKCIDICDTTGSGSSTPDVTIGSGGSKTTHTTLMSAYTGSTTSSDLTIYADSTLFCGLDTGGNAIALPVNFINFNAEILENRVSITWATAVEVNNDHFTVEKAYNDMMFFPLIDVAGAGISSEINRYSHSDILPYKGDVYYRLKQVDFDGLYTYSKIVLVMKQMMKGDGNIYPNPNTNETFNIWVGKDFRTKIIEIVGIDGSLVRKVHPESPTVELKAMESGMYFVHFIDTQIGSVKILKLSQK